MPPKIQEVTMEVTAKATAAAKVVARKHFRAAVKNPHNYYTAAGMTVVMLCFKAWAESAIATTWLFAIVETITQGDDA